MRDLPLPTMPISDLLGESSRRSLHRRSAHVPPARSAATRLEVVWARDEADVRQAQQLRHLVFAEEMGARLTVPHGSPAGLDIESVMAYRQDRRTILDFPGATNLATGVGCACVMPFMRQSSRPSRS